MYVNVSDYLGAWSKQDILHSVLIDKYGQAYCMLEAMYLLVTLDWDFLN